MIEFYILAALQAADAVTTYKVIKAGGYETNKALNWLNTFLRRFTNAKWAWLVVAKAAGLAGSWLVATTPGEVGRIAAIGLAALYVWIVSGNIRALKTLSKRL